MNGEWSLEVLYKSYEDPAFLEDIKKVDAYNAKIKETAAGLKDRSGKEAVLEIIELLEEYSVLFYRLGSYISLRQSVATTDPQTAAYMDMLQRKSTEVSKEQVMFDKFLAAQPELDTYIAEDEKLGQYRFLLEETRKRVEHMLPDDVEEMYSLMNLTGGSAWANMFDYLTSTVVVDYKGEQTNLPAIRNLAYDSDPQVRKDAYEAELAAYEKIKDPIAFALNSIKAQVNMIAEKRGYESPLAMTLDQSKMKRETLDALWTACQEYLPKFHQYLRRKAEMLGYENGLPWYEMFAPMGESDQTFDENSAKEYLLKHFYGFAEDLGDMVKEAFEQEWIDFYPHAGKVGGAFCANLPFVKQSRVLTNFDGKLTDVVTLAHELGHAYHGLLIQDHLPLNTDYSMPVAETASTFNENVIMSAAIAEASTEERVVLLESQLQDLTQIICDIYSRYLFESEVFEKRKNGFLFADELKEIMLNAQKIAYGDGLDQTQLHPFMWTCKGHYYSESLSFYNFPYAFGGLFAKGLYAQYLKEGEAFLPKYRALLHATTISSVEDVAQMAGIDLTKPDFWRSSLELAAQSIDEFLELTKKA